MKFSARGLAALVLVALAGCESMQPKTQAQKQRDRVVALTKESSEAMKSCMSELRKTPSAEKTYREVIVESSNSANRLDLLLSNEYLSVEQIVAMKEFSTGVQNCRGTQLSFLYGVPFHSLVTDSGRRVDDVYLGLLKKELSIGKANEFLGTIRTDFEKQWLEVGADLDRGFQQSHNDEIQGRQRAAAAMMPLLIQQQQQQQQFYQQQMDALKPKPTYNTNCTTYGNTTNCTTR